MFLCGVCFLWFDRGFLCFDRGFLWCVFCCFTVFLWFDRVVFVCRNTTVNPQETRSCLVFLRSRGHGRRTTDGQPTHHTPEPQATSHAYTTHTTYHSPPATPHAAHHKPSRDTQSLALGRQPTDRQPTHLTPEPQATRHAKPHHTKSHHATPKQATPKRGQAAPSQANRSRPFPVQGEM